MIAAERGLIDVIRTLRNARANMNATMTDTGKAALMLAAESGHVEAVGEMGNVDARLSGTATTARTQAAQAERPQP